MTDLKPCPFCGGGAEVGADMTSFPDVACDACGASVSGRGVEAAIAAWNRRAITPAEAARVLLEAGVYTDGHVTRAAARECPVMGFIHAGAVIGAALRAIAEGDA